MSVTKQLDHIERQVYSVEVHAEQTVKAYGSDKVMTRASVVIGDFDDDRKAQAFRAEVRNNLDNGNEYSTWMNMCRQMYGDVVFTVRCRFN